MKNLFLSAIVLMLFACTQDKKEKKEADAAVESTDVQQVDLPEPSESKTNFSNVIGWTEGKVPQAPEGFTVMKFAADLENPRWIYVAPNGDIFVAESSTEKRLKAKVADEISGKAKSNNRGGSADRITLFRDADHDGKPELREVFLQDLNQPFGMLIIGDSFYAANTDGVLKFPYKTGQTKITAAGQKILELPAGGYNNHWTRNLLAAKDNKKIYVSVGSGSNNGEHGMDNEKRRANILVINPDGSGEEIYASGLRNPVGMGLNPVTKELWTSVNERDNLGDDLVPDYLTSVKKDGFYGWPYAYFGKHEDPDHKGQKPELVQKTIVPDVALGAHTASLGMTFYDQKAFPERYQNGVFVGQHGSWNRSQLSGYKVVFVPFKNGKPAGKPEDFLTGFIADQEKSKVYGRPVGVAVAPDGSLLVADDAGNTIWRVSASK